MVPALVRLLPLALATTSAAQQLQAAPGTLMSPKACHTRAELEAWRENTEAKLRSFMPGPQLNFALRTVQKDFERRLGELEKGGFDAVAKILPPPQPAGPPPPPPADEGDYRQYLAHHAGDYARCTQLRQRVSLPRSAVEFPVLLATAEMCLMERDLRVWRSCQLAEVREKVPDAYQRFVVDVLRAQFEQRLAALAPEGAAPPLLPFSARLAATAPQLPASLAVAAVCGSEPELRAWRDHEIADIQRTVPKEYQRFAISSVERTFAKRLDQFVAQAAHGPGGQLQAAGAARGSPRPDAPDVAVELAGQGVGVPHLHLKAVALILCGLVLPALLALGSSAFTTSKRQSQERAAELAEHGFYLQQV